jgi:hypothetical protein
LCRTFIARKASSTDAFQLMMPRCACVEPRESVKQCAVPLGVQEAAVSNPAGTTPAKADKEKLCGYRNTDLGNRGKVHCPNIAQKNLMP